MTHDEAIKGGQAAQARAQRDIGGVWLIVIEEAKGSWGSYIYQGDIRIYPMDNGRKFFATCPSLPGTESRRTFDNPQDAYKAQIDGLRGSAHKRAN